MSEDDRPVLVVGATGFLGRRLVAALLDAGRRVRCLVRDPGRAADLRGDRTQLSPGDMRDPAAVERACDSVRAVYICVHALSRQSQLSGSDPHQDFMDVEAAGVSAIVGAAQRQGVRRIVYVTSIGVAADAVSRWSRGRWDTEQLVLTSGLDATVVRPGMIVGRGGSGFALVERGARGRIAVVLADRSQRFRTIAVDDLARELVELLDEPRSYGQRYDVGSDNVLTIDQMIDQAAAYLGRRPPQKLHLPHRAVARLAPLIERIGGLPRGAIGGFVGPGASAPMVGDTAPIRAVLPTPPRSYRESLARALESTGDPRPD